MGNRQSALNEEKKPELDSKAILGDLITDSEARLLDRANALGAQLIRTKFAIQAARERILHASDATKKELDDLAKKEIKAVILERDLLQAEREVEAAKNARDNGESSSMAEKA